MVRLTGLFLLLFSSFLHASDSYKKLLSMYENKVKPPKIRMHVIDPYQIEKNRDMFSTRKEVFKKCNHLKEEFKIIPYQKCEDKIWAVHDVNYPNRGSLDYAIKAYSALSVEQAKKEIEKMNYFLKIVPSKPRINKMDSLGKVIKEELLAGQLMSEIQFLEKQISHLTREK